MTKANIFMNAGWFGLAGLAGSAITSLVHLPDPANLVSSLVIFAACWVMLFTRNADEYTRGLWTSGASLAFATLLILFLGLPFAEGIYDGFQHVANDAPKGTRDIPAMASIFFAVVAFYVGLFWKRLRGGV